jgi:hypothetical protein
MLSPGTSRHLVFARRSLPNLKATYCRSPSSTGLLEPLAPCGGMPELLAPREVTSIGSKCRFLTTGEYLPPVVFSASPGWLILSAPRGGMLELLAPCWEESTLRWRLRVREFLYMASAISLLFIVFHLRSTRTGEEKSLPTEPHTGGRHCYEGVLPGALKGSLMTLLSPLQRHAALGTIPHTLVSVNQSPACRPKTLIPSATRTPRVEFWRGTEARYLEIENWEGGLTWLFSKETVSAVREIA